MILYDYLTYNTVNECISRPVAPRQNLRIQYPLRKSSTLWYTLRKNASVNNLPFGNSPQIFSLSRVVVRGPVETHRRKDQFFEMKQRKRRNERKTHLIGTPEIPQTTTRTFVAA